MHELWRHAADNNTVLTARVHMGGRKKGAAKETDEEEGIQEMI